MQLLIDVQIGNVEVARRNKEYVEKIKNEYMGVVKEITDQYELLLLELGTLTSIQYNYPLLWPNNTSANFS